MGLFSFQGIVRLATRSAAGKPVLHQDLGNVPLLQLQMQTATTPKNESRSGNRLQIGMLSGAKTATFNLTLDEWTAKNLALALYGTVLEVNSGSATGEALPTPLAVGDVIRLDHPFVSSVVLDDAGTPLVLNTDYRVESANAGLIEILTAQADPIDAAYSYDAIESVTMFTSQPPERWLVLDGINTDNNEPVLLDLYRCRFNPVGDLSLITDEYGNIPLSGSVLYDPLNASDSNLGGFGRAISKQAA